VANGLAARLSTAGTLDNQIVCFWLYFGSTQMDCVYRTNDTSGSAAWPRRLRIGPNVLGPRARRCQPDNTRAAGRAPRISRVN
jgi:hypothetical protein